MYLTKVWDALFSVLLSCNIFILLAHGHPVSELKDVLKRRLVPDLYKEFLFKSLAPGLATKYGVYKVLHDSLNDHKTGKLTGFNVERDDNEMFGFKNRILVKRLLPRGFTSSNYQYDEKYNTLYLPIAKVKGVKPRLVFKKANHDSAEDVDAESRNDKGIATALKKLLKGETGKGRGNFVILNRDVTANREVDEELLQPFKLKQRRVTFQSVLDDIKTYLESLSTKSEVRRLKYAVLSLLENFSPEKRLRAMPSKSEERDNPGLTELYKEFAYKPTTPKPDPKKWMPLYPFWNYWTFEKTIHQDECKGKLIEQGNICIETPPH